MIALVCLAITGATAYLAREDDACVFESTEELYPLSQFEDCVAQIPLDADEVAYPTLKTMEQLLDLFVFEEMAKRPIAPFDDPQNGYKLPAVDVRAGLQAIREQVDGDAFSTDFEFHSAISAVFLPLKDPHTVYAKPKGYSTFSLTLPVTVEARADKNDPAGVSFFLRALPDEYQQFTQRFAELLRAQGRNLPDLLGQKVLSINGRSPIEALQAFADEVVYVSKNPSSRLNSAIQKDFFKRGFSRMNLPSGSADDPRTYTFQLENGETLDVDLYVTVSSAISGEADIISKNARPSSANPAETPLSRFLRDVPRGARRASAPGDGYSIIEDDATYTLTVVREGLDVSLHSLSVHSHYAAGEKTVAYLLSISSFAPDDPAVFTQDFQASLQAVQEAYEARPDQPLYLLVNVMANGGGYITLGYRSLHALAPHVNPVYGNYSIRKSDLSHYFATNGNFSTQKRYDLSTWKELGPRTWYDNSNEVMYFPSGGKMEVSKTYTFDLAYDEVVFEDAFESLWNTPTPDFLKSGNTHLAFITDGLCGSTCACFSKRAREARAGLFLGVGGNPRLYDYQNVPMDVASFAGGSVMDTDFVFSKDHSKDLSKRHDLRALPTSAIFRWAFEQIYSWDDSLEYSPSSTPLEYVNNPVDDYLEYWPRPGSEYTDLQSLAHISVEAYKKVSAKCYDFQVSPAEECASFAPEDSHLAYGAACVSGQFDPKVCKFMECETGYVLNSDGSCTLQPEKTMLPASTVEQAAYICLGVIAGVIVVGLTAFFALKCRGCAKARKAAKENPGENRDLISEENGDPDSANL